MEMLVIEVMEFGRQDSLTSHYQKKDILNEPKNSWIRESKSFFESKDSWIRESKNQGGDTYPHIDHGGLPIIIYQRCVN